MKTRSSPIRIPGPPPAPMRFYPTSVAQKIPVPATAKEPSDTAHGAGWKVVTTVPVDPAIQKARNVQYNRTLTIMLCAQQFDAKHQTNIVVMLTQPGSPPDNTPPPTTTARNLDPCASMFTCAHGYSRNSNAVLNSGAMMTTAPCCLPFSRGQATTYKTYFATSARATWKPPKIARTNSPPCRYSAAITPKQQHSPALNYPLPRIAAPYTRGIT